MKIDDLVTIYISSYISYKNSFGPAGVKFSECDYGTTSPKHYFKLVLLCLSESSQEGTRLLNDVILTTMRRNQFDVNTTSF